MLFLAYFLEIIVSKLLLGFTSWQKVFTLILLEIQFREEGYPIFLDGYYYFIFNNMGSQQRSSKIVTSILSVEKL